MIKTHTLFDATNGNAQKNNALMWKINGCTENTNGKCTQINKNFDWIFFISYQRLRYYYFLLLLLSWIIQVFPVLSLDHSTLCDRSLFSFFSAIFVFFLIKFFFFGLLSDNFCTHKNDYLQRFLTNTKLIPFQTVQQPNLYAQTKTVKNIKKIVQLTATNIERITPKNIKACVMDFPNEIYDVRMDSDENGIGLYYNCLILCLLSNRKLFYRMDYNVWIIIIVITMCDE